MGYQMVTRPITSRDSEGAVRSAILATAWLIVNIVAVLLVTTAHYRLYTPDFMH